MKKRMLASFAFMGLIVTALWAGNGINQNTSQLQNPLSPTGIPASPSVVKVTQQEDQSVAVFTVDDYGVLYLARNNAIIRLENGARQQIIWKGDKTPTNLQITGIGQLVVMFKDHDKIILDIQNRRSRQTGTNPMNNMIPSQENQFFGFPDTYASGKTARTERVSVNGNNERTMNRPPYQGMQRQFPYTQQRSSDMQQQSRTTIIYIMVLTSSQPMQRTNMNVQENSFEQTQQGNLHQMLGYPQMLSDN
ncbi:hypothetical protein [uncultured Sphaerochaeta sp.]|uniref:hypothetical protein n=1 Tax=uncultured Sphaerochaeta sp. TaxID=886478 RepID=UPI002A0A14D3|nr:hypothetical protein [uncultured Sphaerochaeta sp.]